MYSNDNIIGLRFILKVKTLAYSFFIAALKVMRIGASLLLKNGFCYQSYRWQFLRPLGTLQNAVRILEERQVDEISIIRYCRDVDDMDLFKQDVDLVSNIDCITPLSFGGGIRDMRHIQFLHQLPIERILLSSGYIEKNKDLIMELINLLESKR